MEVRCSFSDGLSTAALVQPVLPSDNVHVMLSSHPPLREDGFKDCNQMSERIISSSSMLPQLERKRKERGRS